MRCARIICGVLAVASAGAGCAQGDVEDGSVQVTSTDSTAAADTSDAAPGAATGVNGWKTDTGISYRGEHEVDFTADGLPEIVIATASGPAYDSLQTAVTIVGERGDTLWHESWPSLVYFKYDPVQGKEDTTVARIVRDHVEQLVEPDRFTMDGGLPAVLRRGGDPEAVMREAVRYHLAELDYRRGAGLSPADATPPQAFSSIDADAVADTRVDAVLDEAKAAPSFMYYAGGEATYVIAWSERERAFVRIYSCC